MDSPPSSSLEPSAAAPAGGASRGRWLSIAWTAAIACVVVGIFVYVNFGPRVTWLTPEEFDRATSRPLPLPKIKQLWNLWTTSFFLRFRGTPQTLMLNPTLVALSDQEAEKLKLGEPYATDAAGMRAWVLSRAGGAAFRKRLYQLPGYHPRFSQFMHTTDGKLAHFITAESGTVGTNRVFAGMTIDVVPKLSLGAARYTAGARITEFLVRPERSFGYFSSSNVYTQSAEADAATKTNLTVGCQARLPKGGMLVIQCDDSKDADGNRYWFMLWTVVLDEHGQPVDL